MPGLCQVHTAWLYASMMFLVVLQCGSMQTRAETTLAGTNIFKRNQWSDVPPRLPEPLAALPRPEFHRFLGGQGSQFPVGFMWAYVCALYWFMRTHLGQLPSLARWVAGLPWTCFGEQIQTAQKSQKGNHPYIRIHINESFFIPWLCRALCGYFMTSLCAPLCSLNAGCLCQKSCF